MRLTSDAATRAPAKRTSMPPLSIHALMLSVSAADRVAISARMITSGLAGRMSTNAPSQQVRVGGQRLFEIVQRRQQLQPLAVFATGNQRYLAPLQCIIRQRRCPGGPLPLNVEPRDPGAQFRWQRQFCRGCCRPIRELRRNGRQYAIHCPPDRVPALQGYVSRGSWSRAECGQLHSAILERCGCNRQHIGRGLVDLDAALGFERGQCSVPTRILQTIGEPHRVKQIQIADQTDCRCGIRLPWRGCEARQPAAPNVSGLEHRRLRPGEVAERPPSGPRGRRLSVALQ